MSLNTLGLVWTAYKSYSHKKRHQVHQMVEVFSLTDNSRHQIQVKESRLALSKDASPTKSNLTAENSFNTALTQLKDEERSDNSNMRHFDDSISNTKDVPRKRKIKRPNRNV